MKGYKESRIVRNQKELNIIRDLIDMNRFCLKDSLLDAEKMTNDRVNNLDIDQLENIVQNDIQVINIFEVKKDARNRNRVDYLVNADIYIKDDVYRIKNWFGHLKNKNMFEDSEILTEYMEECI